MPDTIGYHYVRSAYGLWLPGDGRGHWSEAWDEQIGFIEPHTLHDGDPVRLRMAAERMAHPPVRWSDEAQRAILACVQHCAAAASPWDIAAQGIAPTHLHLALTYTTRDIAGTAKWPGQQMTKGVHRDTPHTGPVFCRGCWLQFIYDVNHWDRLLAYIDRHNKAADGIGGLPAIDPADEVGAFIRTVDVSWPARG